MKSSDDKECKRCYTIWCMVCCCFLLCNICEDNKNMTESPKI